MSEGDFSRPNIVLFVTDQQRADTIGAYGSEICRTPNLDRLAEEGIRFEHAYTPIAVCSPARASMLTGLYPHNHGVIMNTHVRLPLKLGLDPEFPTYSSVLSGAGYRLEKLGKWHVHPELGPAEYGYDFYIGNPCGDKLRRDGVQSKNQPGSEMYIDFKTGNQLICSTLSVDEEYTEPYATAESGVERLGILGRNYHDNGQPFLLRMDVVHPHFANRVPQKYASMYEPADIPAWPNFDESFENKPASHLRKHQQWNLQGKDWGWWQQWLARYFGACTLIDHCFGMVLDALDELNLTENTMVIYTTDHADSAGSHKHFEKGGTMYEEVYRVPFIIRWPEVVAQGRVADELVTHLDLMPTLVEAGGASVPEGLDGRSFLPVLRGEEQRKWRDSVYLEYHGDVWGCYTQRTVRTDSFKYVYNPYDLDELYNLEEDPYEMKNLVNMPSYSAVLDEMRARLRGWIEATDDILTHWFVMRNFPEPIYPD